MTIRDVRVTTLRMPWADPEWIKGHALGPDRGILIVDVETAGGITGMGYLFHFRPGLKTIATFIEECVDPARDRQGRDRRRGDLARPVGLHHDLWPRRHRLHGDVGARHCAVGRGRQAREPAAAPAVGPLPLEDPDLRLGLFPRRGRRRHDREGAHLREPGLQGDQDAGRARAHARAGRRERAAHARGGRARHRHHDRRQHGLGRGDRDRDGAQVRGSTTSTGSRSRCRPTTSRAISASRPRSTCAWSAARRISRATTCGRSSSIRACRSCSPTRCAAA